MSVDHLGILIPHYNDPQGLDLSLRSISAQKGLINPRVVIYDDGSEPSQLDGLRRILSGYNGKAELLEGKVNRGRAYARNGLLDAIDSPYVSWLDAGDEWYREKSQTQFAELSALKGESSMVWVTCNYDWKWEGKPAKLCQQRVDQDQVRALLVGRDLRAYLWTLLAPASAFKAIGPFDERLPRLQDLDFFLRFVLAEGKIIRHASSAPLCVYHKSDTGRNAEMIRACNQYILEKHASLYQRYGKRFVRGRQFEMDLLSARVAYKNGDILHGSQYFANAAKRKPLSLIRKLAKQLKRKLRVLNSP